MRHKKKIKKLKPVDDDGDDDYKRIETKERVNNRENEYRRLRSAISNNRLMKRFIICPKIIISLFHSSSAHNALIFSFFKIPIHPQLQ
jgi:hypothetical protein